MIFFTADTHFYHAEIIPMCRRPFATVKNMNNVLVRNWNSCVTDRDEVYILGDFLVGGNARDANHTLRRMKGKKYLVRGNHDDTYLEDSEFDLSLFGWVKDFFILRHDNCDYVLCHYPLLEWPGFHDGAYHLYGHIHNAPALRPDERRFGVLKGHRSANAGVDVQDFFPVSIEDVTIQALLNADRVND
jgi:calcineurin-like phosphoesterase family protein